jgi:cell wall-associated NlpC family hydrolase
MNDMADVHITTPLLLLLSASLLLSGCLQNAPDVTPPTAPPAHSDAATDPATDPHGAPLATSPSGVTASPILPNDPCPLKRDVPQAPSASNAQRTLSYWLTQLGALYDLDAPLLTPTEVLDHDVAVGTVELGQRPELTPQDTTRLTAHVNERLDYLHKQLTTGAHVNADGGAVSAADLAHFQAVSTLALTPRLHLSLGVIPLRCGPRVEGFYKAADIDLRFDRNACSALRDQELIEVLATWPNGMHLVRSRYVMGWVAADAPLSPPLPEHLRAVAASSTRWHTLTPLTLRADSGDTHAVEAGTRLLPAPSPPGSALFATAAGFFTSQPLSDTEWATDARPLTRRALLEEAFSFIDQPYGWGGYLGGRDCSRFLLDVFARFNLHLPRHSADQAASGTFSLDLSRVTSASERLLLLDEAAKRGAVFLFFPGHIMLYLGRADDGRPMAIHSLAEYVTSCPADVTTQNPSRETVNAVHKVTVTDLSVGLGTSRTSFLERITQVTVIGAPPGESLDGVASRRPSAPLLAAPDPADCKPGADAQVFFSPERPHIGQPLRVIATVGQDPGAAQLTLIAPDGSLLNPKSARFGGPPYSFVVTLNNPAEGAWMATLGEGQSRRACAQVEVAARPKPRQGTADAAWKVERAWSPALEDLYAAFVESLFSHSMEGDPTWTNLHSLLQDEDRNILFNHLGHREDLTLKMEPDCADLPYFLRAYFAWKMALPYGFRKCNRGQSNSPPTCEATPQTNLSLPKGAEPVRAFDRFVNGDVRNVVHSASGRTGPGDDNTDYYPVPLTRRALRPGTLYADPYGHLLVIARWEPQGFDRYGVLVAADAQPDGTVGLKRFWRGTFLFSSDTKTAGAGFKAFRPLVMRGGSLTPIGNDALRPSSPYVPHSMDQYKGTDDDFYDAMDALINPRPLDPFAMQVWLIDALAEAVQFRLVAVDNGEQFMKKQGGRAIDMPSGKAIFNTVGPWEDFATPSRDMRVLIALDTVQGFVDRAAKAPQRFGIDPDDAAATIARLREALAEELGKRTFSYVRTDGVTQTLTLQDLVARKPALEMAYNPNDCIEHRWGAPEGSPERASCHRAAPPAQRQKMNTYRAWFAKRARPNH